MKQISYGKAVYGKSEIRAVINTLKKTTQMGKKVSEFETKIAKLFNKKHGIMTNSGSSALFLAIDSLRLPKNSEVITPCLTFATTVSSLIKNNLIPAFVDVDIQTLCIKVDDIESKINSKTKAILIPDLIGNISDWKRIKRIANKYKLKIVHDSADTLGALIDGKPTGTFSDISITSFYGSHVITAAGNGGMVCTSNSELNKKMKLLRSWGRSSSIIDDKDLKSRFDIKLEGIPYDKKFVFEEIGYQLEPSELSASFGLEQLKGLNRNIKLRESNFKMHFDFFSKYKDLVIPPNQLKNSKTGWLAYPIILKEDSKISRQKFQMYLEKNKIQTRVIFTGNILRQPGFKNIKCKGKVNQFPNSDYIMRNGLLIGCHHGLLVKEIKYIHKIIREYFKKFN